jgi:hypothetical protein
MRIAFYRAQENASPFLFQNWVANIPIGSVNLLFPFFQHVFWFPGFESQSENPPKALSARFCRAHKQDALRVSANGAVPWGPTLIPLCLNVWTVI